MENEELRNAWDNIFAAKGWSYTDAAKKLGRNKTAVTRLVNGTTTDPKCIMHAFQIVTEKDSHRPVALPSGQREEVRMHYGLDEEWWKAICSRFIEKPLEEKLLPYEESIKRFEQYIKGEKSDPILRGVLSPDQWKKRRERINTHLTLPLESIKHFFQGSSEGDHDEETKT